MGMRGEGGNFFTGFVGREEMILSIERRRSGYISARRTSRSVWWRKLGVSALLGWWCGNGPHLTTQSEGTSPDNPRRQDAMNTRQYVGVG